MTRHLKTLATAITMLAVIAGAPRMVHACSQPFPSNVGVALTPTPTGFLLTLYGGTAFPAAMNAGCGCAVALPIAAALKLGCMFTGASITDTNGNDIGFGGFTANATTAASFQSYFSPAFDPLTFNVFGFATTLSQSLVGGEGLIVNFELTCNPPIDAKLRKRLAKFLKHSSVIGTGPVMPDGSVEIGDPGHLGVTTASVNDKCQPAKKKCVIKKQDCLFKCHVAAESNGVPLDPSCISKCEDKFDGGVIPEKGCIAKIEAKGGCIVGNQTAGLEATIDAYVLDVVTEVDPGFPTPIQNPCSAAKKACAARKTSALLKCYAKAEQKQVPVDPNCVAKVMAKFSDCWAGAEILGGCPTVGDEAAIEAKVDAFVNDVECQIDPPTCP